MNKLFFKNIWHRLTEDPVKVKAFIITSAIVIGTFGFLYLGIVHPFVLMFILIGGLVCYLYYEILQILRSCERTKKH